MKTIEDVLNTNGHALLSVTPNSPVNHTMKQMAEEHVEALPVVESGKLVGVIYEKDVITKVLLNGRSIEETQVKDVMTPDYITVSPIQTVDECLDVMTEKQIQHIPVIVDSSLLGFVSMSDLFRTIIDEQKEYLYRLDNYILGIDFGR